MTLSVARFCNLVYYWSTRGMNAEQRDSFDGWLQRPVTGSKPSRQVTEASGPWSRDAELAQFRSSGG